MKHCIITAAPQAKDTEFLFPRWLDSHTGTKEDFFIFMTTPSAARSAFLAKQPCETEVTTRLLTATY